MQQINITEIIKGKSPNLAKRLPKFIIRWLEKTICVDRINHVLGTYSNLPPMDFIDATFDYIGVKYSIHGVDNIPNERVIFASNHPLGGLDGMALVRALNTASEHGVKVIVNDILMYLDPLSPVFIPINKHGKQKSHNLKAYNSAFESDLNIITFPSGLCSRLVNGEIVDLEWKTNFVQRAISTGRTIIPIYVEGTNSKFFYRFSKWRRRLQIKLNLEMLYLPKEMFGQKDKHINIYVGKPITVDKSRSLRQWSEIVRIATYSLKNNHL